MGMMSLFKTILLVQLFYAFSITLLVYTMPADSLNYVTGFSDITQTVDLQNTATLVQDSITDQTNIPVVELGSLIFFSGNILIDLLLNFAFAIPEMIGMIINGLMLLINIDSQLFAVVQLFASVVVTVLYFIGIIQLLTSIRSGRSIA